MHGIQFPTDPVQDPFPIQCDFHGGSGMVPWANLRALFLFLIAAALTAEKPPFPPLLERQTAVNAKRMRQRRRPCFQVWFYFLLGFLGEVNQLRTFGVDRPRPLRGNNV